MSNIDADQRDQSKTMPSQPPRPQSHTRKREEIVHQFAGTGMTPSIITTINNTNPSPTVNHSSSLNNSGSNNNNGNTVNSLITRGNRRSNEPYESYIEDSFVGHWENEDDGYEHQEEFDAESQDGSEHDKSDLQHPSTIEFDFDSFGPESIIYAPANVQQADKVITPATRPLPLVETGRQAEKAEETQTSIAIGTSQQQHQSEKVDGLPSDLDAHANTPSVTLHQTRVANLSPLDHLVDLAQVDLKVIEPYKKVISHAGYCHHYDPGAPEPNPGDPAPAVIVFSACYLPDRSRRDYNYVMDHLFLYVLSSLHELIADDYILIYLHNTQPSSDQSSSGGQSRDSGTMNRNTNGGQSPNNLPTFSWMKRCYQMIDRKLRKNLKILYLVKPTFWLKTIVIMCKPFISTKFSKKLRFVEDMNALRKCVPVDKLILPASAENL